MKKNTKKILAFAFMAVFIISVVSVAGLSAGKSSTTLPSTTNTGTPADNYPDDKRPTFCGTGTAKSNKYISEFKIPTVCTQPLSITTDPSGNVWFTESNTGKLAKFDPFTRIFTEYDNAEWPKGEKAMMWGIAYSQDGNIWYTDEAHDVIWKFSISEKNFIHLKYPVSASVESFPQRLVIYGQKIIVNDFTGNKITFLDLTQTGQELKYSKIVSPTNDTVTGALTIDSSGTIWYTSWKFQEGGNLFRYNPQSGDGAGFSLPLGIQAPNGISADSQGKIWINDAGSSFFFKFDPQLQQYTKLVTSPPQEITYGNASGLIKSPITRPYWNHFDQNGRLWFNEQTGNSLAVFDPSKESLVEYLVPSQNPNWSDCGDFGDCGVAQVLDFTVNGDKIWFTEWVENNIGVLDSKALLPFEVSVDKKDLTLSRGDNVTLSFTITPKEEIAGLVRLVSATTAGLHNVMVTNENQNVIVGNQPETVSFNISADQFALPGTYKILFGARNNEITISEYVTVTIK